MMSIIYFTVVAILLYLAADWLLDKIEQRAGRRFEYRSVIFFFILLTLALATFSVIQQQTAAA